MTITQRGNVTLSPTGSLIKQILEYYPKKSEIYITSGTDGDHGLVSHHYGLTYQGSPTAALDIGAGGVTPDGSRRMRDLAKWLYDNFATQLVELIHTTPYSTDNGFYVKHGKKYPGGGPYAGATARAHLNHVHVATSKALAEAILAKLRGRTVPAPRSAPSAPAPATPATPTPATPTPATANKNRLDLPFIQAGSMGGVRPQTQILVIHATDNARASAEDEAAYMRRRPDKVSCHVVVDGDSAIQTVPLNRVAHCAYPTANSRGIHIELCGVSNALPKATIARGAKIAAVICRLWDIPIRSLSPKDLTEGVRGICGHDDVTAAWHTGPDRGASHTDPGPLFPWADFIGQVQVEYNRLFASTSGIHVVRAGNTLTRIASQYGLTLAQIRALNPQITDPNLIRVGDEVRVS